MLKSTVFIAILLVMISCGTTLDKRGAENITKIAFGSCAKQWEPQPIWNTILNQKPDLFLFIGDAIYGDWDGKNVFEVNEMTLERDYNQFNSIPEFKSFQRNIPIEAIWDNHDYGSHNGGVEFEKKELTRTHFLDFFKVPINSHRRTRGDGIYSSKIIGEEGKRIQVILLDTRWNRTPFKLDTLSMEERKEIGKIGKYIASEDSSATILGYKQWKWLEEELSKPADVRLICSSTQVIPNQKGMDEWGDYPLERQKLLSLISQKTGNNVILLTGNVHFAELSKFSTKTKDIYELTSSGLTHVNESYAKAPNKFRKGKPFVNLNFGLIEVDWERQLIDLGVVNKMGIKRILYSLELKIKK